MMYLFLIFLLLLGLLSGFLLAKNGAINISDKKFTPAWLQIIGSSWLIGGALVFTGFFSFNVDWSAHYAAAIGGMMIGAAFVLLHKITREIKFWGMPLGGVFIGLILGSLVYKSIWVALPPQWFVIIPKRTHLLGLIGIESYEIAGMICGLLMLILGIKINNKNN